MEPSFEIRIYMSRLLPSTVLRPSPYPSPDRKLYGRTRQTVRCAALHIPASLVMPLEPEWNWWGGSQNWTELAVLWFSAVWVTNEWSSLARRQEPCASTSLGSSTPSTSSNSSDPFNFLHHCFSTFKNFPFFSFPRTLSDCSSARPFFVNGINWRT